MIIQMLKQLTSVHQLNTNTLLTALCRRRVVVPSCDECCPQHYNNRSSWIPAQLWPGFCTVKTG